MKIVLQQVGRYKKDTFLTNGPHRPGSHYGNPAPLYNSRLIDQGLEASNLPVVIRYGLIMVGMSIVSLIFGALAGKFAANASAGFAANLREAIYNTYRPSPFPTLTSSLYPVWSPV